MAENLRERRRRQTRAELHAAALRLVRELGFDRVTVEMISKEAGVSPRTFFNYFPTKEAALLILPSGPSAEEAGRFAALPGSDPGTVLRDVGDLLARPLEELPFSRAEVAEAARIAEAAPTVLAAVLAGFELLERELVALIAQRLGEDPEAELPALLAGMCTTAVRLGTRRWAQAGPGAPGAAECVRHAFALVNDLVPPTA
ncbi:TetR/AcrR family transcriptional regulator [Streptomyces albidoflavus]